MLLIICVSCRHQLEAVRGIRSSLCSPITLAAEDPNALEGSLTTLFHLLRAHFAPPHGDASFGAGGKGGDGNSAGSAKSLFEAAMAAFKDFLSRSKLLLIKRSLPSFV